MKEWQNKLQEALHRGDESWRQINEDYQKKHNKIYSEKIEQCDPEVWEDYKREREEEQLSSIIDPNIREFCVDLKKWGEEVLRVEKEKEWKSNIARNSWKQLKYLRELIQHQQTIFSLLRKQEEQNSRFGNEKLFILLVLVVIMVFVLLIRLPNW